MRWLRGRNRKSIAFWSLMGFSGLSLLAPAGWSDGLKHLTQLLVPFQSAVYHTAFRTAHRLKSADDATNPAGVPADRDRAALENSVAALNQMLEDARRENGQLKGLRERYIPPGVRLVTARVAMRDISAWRDGLLLARGAGLDADKKVRRRDAVTSRVFVGAGSADRVDVGHLVLAREYLLGEIDQVSPFTSRVRLFCDLDARVEVRVGRVAGRSFRIVDYPCILVGRGRGEMVIENVPRRYVADEPSAAADTMRAGDLVMSLPRPPAMPAGMAIGTIESFQPDLRRPLVVTVHVRPALPPEEIEDVFIVSTSAD